MPEQTQLSKPEIIVFPGENAELPAKLLEREIYADPERFQAAMKLGAGILNDIVVKRAEDATPQKNSKTETKKTPEADNDEVKDAKILVSGIKRILNDPDLRKSIWFDEDTEARIKSDTKHAQLQRKSPRTEQVLKELRFQQFSVFVDRAVEFSAQDKASSKKGLRKTG